MSESTNPLGKYFRQPQLYIRLPSDGKWYPNGALEMTETRELPIYAMTAIDEVTLKTPDALLNGQSTVNVIQSCAPNIKDPWVMPVVDLDAILIAIRKATYGNEMEFSTICPHCKNSNEDTLNLSALADQITCPNFDQTIKIDDLEIFLKPQNFKAVNEKNKQNYEQQKILQVIGNDQLADDEKKEQFNNLFFKILTATVDSVADSVAAIKIKNEVVVNDRSMIHEFLKNCNKDMWEKIKETIESIAKDTYLNKIPIKCKNESCLKDYETPLVFEATNFFV